MQAIIEQIQAAEQQADEIRQEAVAAAREDVKRTKAEVEDAREALIERERQSTKDALERAETDGEEQSRADRKVLVDEADALCQKAMEKLPAAVQSFVEKVQADL